MCPEFFREFHRNEWEFSPPRWCGYKGPHQLSQRKPTILQAVPLFQVPLASGKPELKTWIPGYTQNTVYALKIPSGFRVFQAPRVKSGTSTGRLRLATEISVSSEMALQAAASYTSMSSGTPSRRHLISR